MKPFLAQHRTQTLSGYETTGNPIVVRTQKEKPILFCGSMVRAILEGRKTQTRRVAKGLGSKLGDEFSTEISSGEIVDTSSLCPHGQVGDRLWVKENHRLLDCECKETCRIPSRVWYESDASGYENASLNRLRPSIFMPRWASRITLEITGVRVERVQEIDPRDCIDEGIDFKKHECGCETCARSSKLCPATGSSLIMEYSELWDSINGKKHPWSSNPWVWVVTFKQI